MHIAMRLQMIISTRLSLITAHCYVLISVNSYAVQQLYELVTVLAHKMQLIAILSPVQLNLLWISEFCFTVAI